MAKIGQNKKPNTKKKILVLIFILFNAAVILWTALSEFTDNDNKVKLSDVKINGWLLLPALLIFSIGILSEILKYILMMKKCCSTTNWRTAARTFLLGRYYDNITPAAVGGQPFQFMYMKKQGIRNGYSTIIPVMSMISTQIGFLIVAISSYIFLGNRISIGLLGSGCLGLVFYAFFPVAIILAIFFRDKVSKIVAWGVKLLTKIKIVKNKNETISKTEATIDKYVNCIKTIAKNKKLTISLIALSILFQICIGCIPFFVLKAFGGDINFLTCFVTTLCMTSAIYFVPTPGNAGAAEGSFFFIFNSLATSGYTFWAMISWRFFSYYFYIIAGIITYALIAYEKKTGRFLLSDIKNWLKSSRQKAKKA